MRSDITKLIDNNYDEEPSNCWTKYRYMFAYSLMLSTLGALESFSSALFVEFENQLDVDTVVIALIFTVKSISFGISAIICAFIIDSFHSTHYFVSLSIFFSCISITLIPYIKIVSIMYILFIFIGYTLGIIFVSFPVYIFRKYPQKQDKMMYIVMVIYGITKTAFPIIIQLSISLTSQYKYALFLITFISLLSSISLLMLSTPTHDNYRTVKQSIALSSELPEESMDSIEKKSKQVVLVLSKDKKHIYTQWIIIILLSFMMASFSATQSGLVNFITSYCNDYLFIDESIGRYMISGYYCGQLLYRVMLSAFLGNKNLKKLFIPQKTILIGFFIMNIFLILFVLFDTNSVLIFSVYIICGIFGSGIFPDIFKWCENMIAVSGVLSSVFIIGFSGGDAIIVLIIGELFDVFTPKVLPYSLLTVNIIGTLLVLITILLYRKYNKHKNSILATSYSDISFGTFP